MKIAKVNSFFKKFAEWQIKHRIFLLVGVFLFLLFGLIGLKDLTIANDQDQWFNDAEPIKIATEKFEDQFGNNQLIGILIESKDVFNPHVLQMIKELGDELLSQVPYANEITSLVEVEISIGTKDGMKIINPFENGIPDDPAKIEEIRKLFFSRQALANKIVSVDSTETWLSLSLLEYPEPEEWKKETNIDPMFQSGEVVIKVVEDPKWKSDLYTIKIAGLPYTETKARELLKKETAIRFSSVFISMVILLAFFLRSFFGVIVPALSGFLSVVVVFGYTSYFNIGVNANMAMVPMILGMSLSIAYSVHLVNSFKRAYRICHERKKAAILSVEETGWPLFFTVITTVGSVLSFVSAGIVAISWVGFISAGIVLTSWLLVMLLVPILLSFGKNAHEKQNSVKEHSSLEKPMQLFGELIIRRKGILSITFLIMTLLIAPGIFKMKVNMDTFEIMGLKIPYIKKLHELTQSQLGSYLSYDVTISFDEPDSIKEPDIMNNFEGLVDLVSRFELTKKNKENAVLFSILDILKEMNQTLHEDNIVYHKIPQTREMIAQLLFLYEISGGTKLFNWIDEDYSMLRLQVQLNSSNSKEMVREMEKIKEYGKENFPQAKVSIIGSAVQFAEINQKIVAGELKSVAIAVTLISVLLFLVFGSVKTGLIGMIPNLAPLIAIGGYMGYFNFSLDMMTMTIIPMLLGIAVDDTIHFINHIKYEFEKHGNYEEAIITSFKNIGTTLAMTTIILAVSFSMYIFSPMAAMARIGFLSSLGLIVALLTDYIVTPILILYTHPFGKQKK